MQNIFFTFLTLCVISHSTFGYAASFSNEVTPASTSFPVDHSTHTATLETSTTVKAKNHIILTSQVNGLLLDPEYHFKPGKKIQKGSTIAEIDHTELLYTYYANKSTFIKLITQLLSDFRIQFPNRVTVWRSFLEAYDIKKPVPELPPSPSTKERTYLSAKSILNTYYSLKSLEASLEKYRWLAPFDGTVVYTTHSHLDHISQGQSIGSFAGGNTYTATVSMPARYKDLLTHNNSVLLSHPSFPNPIKTTITSVSSLTHEDTQSIFIYLEFESPYNLHHLVMTARIKTRPIDNSAYIPIQYIRNHTVQLSDSPSLTPITLHYIENNTALVTGLKQGSTLILPN